MVIAFKTDNFEELFPRIWAANEKMPIDRDTQILLMMTVKQRHEELIKRLKENKMF